MHQMVRDEEGIERTGAHLVQVQIVLLPGVGMLGEAVDLSQRRYDYIVDRAAECAQLLNIVELADL